MNVNAILQKYKKPLTIAVAVIAVALVVFLLLLATTKGRIPGIWSGGPVYLEKYDSNCYQNYNFYKDGTFDSVMTNASGDVLKAERGTWEVSGFDVKTHIPGEIGTGVYHYNPITNTLTSGWWTYEKD